MNDHKYSYFCYFCAGNHSGERLLKCKHFICKDCSTKHECLICIGSLTLTQLNNDRIYYKPKKRKFKDILNNEEEDDLNHKDIGKRKISLKFNKVIDDMMKDFELLDCKLIVNGNSKKIVLNQDKENSCIRILKRNKLF